jgi:hypothetical protein
MVMARAKRDVEGARLMNRPRSTALYRFPTEALDGFERFANVLPRSRVIQDAHP